MARVAGWYHGLCGGLTSTADNVPRLECSSCGLTPESDERTTVYFDQLARPEERAVEVAAAVKWLAQVGGELEFTLPSDWAAPSPSGHPAKPGEVIASALRVTRRVQIDSEPFGALGATAACVGQLQGLLTRLVEP